MKRVVAFGFTTFLIAATPSPAQEAIVADHTVVGQFEQIPLTYINLAKAKKILFMHQSTGDYIWDLGLGCLAGVHDDPNYYPQECVNYAGSSPYDRSNWTWPLWYSQYGGPMADAIAKMDQFVTTVNALVTPPSSPYNVVGMKFCYVDGWNQAWYYDPQWWPTPPSHGYRYHYRQHMEDLERANPGKQFIWATSALWVENHPNCGDIRDFNEGLRSYARANGKLLFDIADIESHDVNGNPCSQNGCESMCSEYSIYPPNNDSHPNVTASIRLAKAFWWLMARASGWSGLAGQNQAPTVSAGPDATVTLSGVFDLSGQVSDDGLPNPPGAVAVTWSKISGPGTVNFGNPNAAVTSVRFSAIGSYVLRLTAFDGSLSAFDETTVTVNSSPAPPHNLRIKNP